MSKWKGDEPSEKGIVETFSYTNDAASFIADFGWYNLAVCFDKDDRLITMSSSWCSD